jgi:L-threonylcarbamoyladenylate synthase
MHIENNPITIIYDEPQNLAQNLIAKDNTIAIRIPDNDFCFNLLRKFNGAIVSTSANITGQPTPNSFKEIHEDILKGVDYVVNLPDEKIGAKPSSIIKLDNDGKVQIIRH